MEQLMLQIEVTLGITEIKLQTFLNKRFLFNLLTFSLCILYACRTQAQNDSLTALSYHKSGVKAYQENRFDEAIMRYHQALSIRKKIFKPLHPDIARSTLNIGIAHKENEAFELAERYLTEAFELYRSLKMNKMIAQVNFELGWVFRNLGDYRTALLHQKNALRLYEEVFGRVDFDVAFALEQLAITYDEMGDHHLATDQLNLALEIYEKLEDDLGIATSHQNLGNAADRLKDYNAAEAHLSNAKELYFSFGSNYATYYADALSDLSLVYFHQSKLDEAISIADSALSVRRSIYPGKHPDIAMSLDNIGNYRDAKLEFTDARELYDQALDQIEGSNQEVYRLTILNDKLNSFLKEYDISNNQDSKVFIESCISETHDQIHKMNVQFSNERSKLFWISQARKIHEQILTFYFLEFEKKKSDELSKKILDEIELSKSLLLLEEFKKSQNWRQGNTTELLKNESAIQSKISYWSLEEEAKNTNAIDSLLYWNNELKKNQLVQVSDTVSTKASSSKSQNVWAALIKKLPKKTATLNMLYGSHKIYIQYLSADFTTNYSVDLSTKVRKLIDDLHSYVSQPPQVLQQKDEQITHQQNHLFNLLFPHTVINSLRKKDQILILPDGGLMGFPFETIRNSSSEYLVENFNVSYHHSVRMYLEGAQRNIKKYRNASIVHCAPDFSNHTLLPTLRGTDQEWKMIGNIFEKAVQIKEAPTNLIPSSEMFNYSIAHISTHAFGDSSSSFSSYLAWPAGRSDVTPIYNWQLSKLPWQNDLVVLASCETGIGQLRKGEGVYNIARSFFNAGVPNAMFSQWRSNDETNASILVEWYQNLSKGNGPSQSLRTAKLNYLDDPLDETAHPYYWANMVYWGEVEKSNSFCTKPFFQFTLGAICIFALFFVFRFTRPDSTNS